MAKFIVYTENYFQGGLEKFIFDLLKCKEIEVHIIVNSENSRIINFATNNDIKYSTVCLVNYKLKSKIENLKYQNILRLINYFLNIFYIIPNYFKIKKSLKSINSYSKILIVNGGYPAAVSCFSAALAAKSFDFEKIGLSILSSPSPNYKNSFYRVVQQKLDLFFDTHIDLYLPNSNAIKTELINTVHLSGEKIETVYTGVDIPIKKIKTDILKYSTNVIKKNNGDIWLGMLGLLGSTKRQDLIIDALKDLSQNIKLLLVGDGPKMGYLMKKVEDLGLSHRVVFTGWINETQDVYSFLDIVTFVSDQEGLPYAISESMAHMVPIIASNVGGINEQIIDNKGGLLISNNKDDLVEKINFLILNEELKEEFVAFSYQHVKKFLSIDAMNKKIIKIYE